ncbi:MAG: hypothetical protein J7518_10890 [Nocardioidaceae bacterium]|nr:hypothetical protein [Nocardioidaceae bacterium]
MTTTVKTRILRTVAAAVAAAFVATPALLAAPADAKAPRGSLAEVILEPGALTGDPTHAIHRGWWGHGTGATPARTGSTFLSLDLADQSGKVTAASTAALGKKLQDQTLENLRVAFVPYSADGSNERPAVTKGQNAGEVFDWFTDAPFGAAWNGAASKNDAVFTVSTLSEWTAWWKVGRPLQGYSPDLKVLNVNSAGSGDPTTTPEGASILNRWPAGTKISMVFYLADGYDKTYPLIPRVAVGPDGRAISAWLTFRTVANPTDPARTSAGFEVLTYSPPSAYPGGGKAGTTTGEDASGAPAAQQGESESASSARASSKAGDGSTSENWLVAAVPGGRPVLFSLLAVVVLAALVGCVALLRRGAAASGHP